MILESFGLRVDSLIYKPDIAQNAVLDQLINGIPVEPGTMVPMGTGIDLVLGDGLGDTKVKVPNLVGRTVFEAEYLIHGFKLNLGFIDCDSTVKDTMEAYIYKQFPNPSNKELLYLGQIVNIFVTQDQNKLIGSRDSLTTPRIIEIDSI